MRALGWAGLAVVALAATGHAAQIHKHPPRWSRTPLEGVAGVELAPWSVPSPPDAMADAPPYLFHGYRHVIETRSRYTWLAFALFGDTLVTWPRGRTLVLELDDSTQLAPRELFAMTPCLGQFTCAQTPIRLERGALLNPRELWRKLYRDNGRTATVLFAAYPIDSLPDVARVSRVRVGVIR